MSTPFERINRKDNHRRHNADGLTVAWTHLTRSYRDECGQIKDRASRRQIIVVAVVLLRNPGSTRGQASPIGRESLELFNRELFPLPFRISIIEFFLSRSGTRGTAAIRRDHFLHAGQLTHQRVVSYQRVPRCTLSTRLLIMAYRFDRSVNIIITTLRCCSGTISGISSVLPIYYSTRCRGF